MLGSSYCDWIRESLGKLRIFSIQNDPSQLASSPSDHNPRGVGEEYTRTMATMASVAGVACHQPKTTVYGSCFHGSFSKTRKNSFSTYNSISFSTSISCKFQSKKSLSWSSSRCRATPLSNIRASSSKEGAEQTYIMIKPDGVQRGLVGEIISRFERKGFLLRGLKLFQCPAELAEEHYKELKEKPFYPKLVKYIISGPVVCMVWQGPGVVAASRKLIGVTNPLQAEPGTIRGDFGIQVGRNVVHGSDSQENGQREIALWFKDSELCEWTQEINPWLFE